MNEWRGGWIIGKVHFFFFIFKCFCSKVMRAHCIWWGNAKIFKKQKSPSSPASFPVWHSGLNRAYLFCVHTDVYKAYSDVTGAWHCFYKISLYFTHCFATCFSHWEKLLPKMRLHMDTYTFFLKLFVWKSDTDGSFSFISCLSTEVICQPLKKLRRLPAA